MRRNPEAGIQQSQIPQMDTLRMLAMLGVFLHHLWKAIIQNPQGPLQRSLDVVFSASSDGVVVFNILSGFLLALPYLGAEHRPFTGYRHFLGKRLLRIVPPYYIALIVFTWANVLVFDFPVASALNMLFVHVLFINSLIYKMMNTNFAHFWYLGMLAHFYLVFPLLLRLFQRAGPARAALLTAVVCWGGWCLLSLYLSANPNSSLGMAGYLMHFNLPGRLPEFAIGMWMASLWNKTGASQPSLREGGFDRSFALFLLTMLLYLILGAQFTRNMALPLLHIYHVSLCVVFVVIMLLWEPVARFGRTAFVMKMAGLSYALYIVHMPLTSYIGVMPGKVTPTIGAFLGYLALLLPLCAIAAQVLDYMAEWTVRRIKSSRLYS